MHEIVKRNILVSLVLKKLLFLKKVTLFLKNNTSKKNVICLITGINKVCTFYLIIDFYSLWITFIREIDWYPSFLKFTTSKKIFYLLKDMTFKNTIYLINRIHLVSKLYTTTHFYTLFMQLVR